MDNLTKINKQITDKKDDNRLELLLFRLQGPTLYGVNVFKTKEILKTPAITLVPKADKRILGLLTLRGKILTAIDMAISLDLEPQDLSESLMLYTEFSRKELCFIINSVERIVYYSWDQVQLPPSVLSKNPYITGIANFEGEIVQVIDIEKILSDVSGNTLVIEDVSDDIQSIFKNRTVIGVDDSKVARQHLKNIFESIGVNHLLVKDGKEAIDLLNNMNEQKPNTPMEHQIMAVVSDIEMPEMDGYTLTKQIRENPSLKNLSVILNSSLSETVGKHMAKKAGADSFLTKWETSDLITKLKETLNDRD